MGIDLNLIVPINKTPMEHISYLGYTTINLNRCRDLWDQINLKANKTLVKNVSIYQESDICYNDITDDAYGNPLYSVEAKQLGEIFKNFDNKGYPMNNAIAPFLLALPEDWPIILYWH